MLRISVTTIDAFRKYLLGEITEESLLKRIRGEFAPSKYMDFGTAFHDILENPYERIDWERLVFKSKNGYKFGYDLIIRCYESCYEGFSPDDITNEVKLTKVFEINSEPVEVVAKADMLLGNNVIENKTCWGYYDFHQYERSYQWRYYAVLFDADRVGYNVFLLKESDEGFQLNGIEKFSFSRYDDLEKDCERLLNDFVEYIHLRGLESYFEYSSPREEISNQNQQKGLEIIKTENSKVEDKNMTIQKIKIANLLGIEELEFVPGKFTEISGKNGSGKTSILESIKHAINGGHDAKLLRNGADKGEIVLILDDGVQLTKTVTETKSDLKLTDRDGKRINKPQTYIDRLIDMISVNPVQFLTADKKNRVNYLLEAIPMKLSQRDLEGTLNGMTAKVKDDLSGHALDAISRINKQFYDDRTLVNRLLKEKASTVAQLKESVIDGVMLPDELSQRIQELENKRGEMEGKRSFYIEQATNTRIKKLDEEEDLFEDELERLRQEHEERKEEILMIFENQKNEIDKKFNAKYVPLTHELTRLHEQAKQAASIAKTKELVEQFENECRKLKEDSEKLTQALQNLDSYKASLLNDIPIKDLEIREGEIFCRDVAFDKLNTAQQVKIAVEVAKLRASELGIICVDGIERLDSDTFNEFKEKAIESGLQMIVTKVGDSELNIKTELAA